MCKIIEFNSRVELDDDDMTMTLDEIDAVIESIDQDMKEHPERFSAEARALIECGDAIMKLGDTEFETAKRENMIRNTIKEVGSISLPGPEDGIDW